MHLGIFIHGVEQKLSYDSQLHGCGRNDHPRVHGHLKIFKDVKLSDRISRLQIVLISTKASNVSNYLNSESF